VLLFEIFLLWRRGGERTLVRAVDGTLDDIGGPHEPARCRIVVVGVGGAGSNTVARLMEMGLTDTECIAINTDKQHLNATNATRKVLIGRKITDGVGAGGEKPQATRLCCELFVHDERINVAVLWVLKRPW